MKEERVWKQQNGGPDGEGNVNRSEWRGGGCTVYRKGVEEGEAIYSRERKDEGKVSRRWKRGEKSVYKQWGGMERFL